MEEEVAVDSFLEKIKDTPYCVCEEPLKQIDILQYQRDLVKNNLPMLPLDFINLLHFANGISYDGAEVWAIFPQQDCFKDIKKENLGLKFERNNNLLILGINDFDYLAYNKAENLYQIIDRQDWDVLAQSPDLSEMLSHILKIEIDR